MRVNAQIFSLIIIIFVELITAVKAQPNDTAFRWCPSDIVIHAKKYYQFYLNLTSKPPSGLFPKLVANISDNCCHGRALDVRFVEETSQLPAYSILYHERDLMELRGEENNSTLRAYFPAYTVNTDTSSVYRDFYFVQLIRSPGPSFIMLREDMAEAPDPSTILVECWPLFLLLFVMAWVVGVLGWFLDHWQNSDQFPENFYRGSWDGFWWAMVTMTTVGYGDKTPLSFGARVLTVLWMITGTIITSLFTANVTSVLTTSNVAALQNVMGQKVGVLNSKYFFQTEINEGASFIEYHDQASLEKAFGTKKVSRVLVPNYLDHLYFLSKTSQARHNVIIANVIKRPFSVGMALLNRIDENKEMKRFMGCWSKSILNNLQMNDFDYSILDPSLYHAFADAKTLLNHKRILKLIYSLIGVLFVFLCLGTVWEYWKRKHKSQKNFSNGNDESAGFEMGKSDFSKPTF